MATKYHIIKHRAFFKTLCSMAFGAVGGQCEKLRRQGQCLAKTIVTVRRADPEVKGVLQNF